MTVIRTRVLYYQKCQRCQLCHNHCSQSSLVWLLIQQDILTSFFTTLGSVTRLGDLLYFGQLFKAFLHKSLTFLGNFCIGVKSYHLASEIIFGQLLQTFGDFFLVTLNFTCKRLVPNQSLPKPQDCSLNIITVYFCSNNDVLGSLFFRA